MKSCVIFVVPRGCMIFFTREVAWFPPPPKKKVAWFFWSQKVAWFFVPRGCVIFVQRGRVIFFVPIGCKFPSSAIYKLCQSMPGTAEGQAGTKQGNSRDKQLQDRDKQGQAGIFPFCPCLSLLVPVCPCLSLSVHACSSLSLSVPVCPCLSLSVLVCPCLSLYISIFAKPSCLPLQMNITVFISINIVTLTFLAKATVQLHANLVLNFFYTFPLASSILFYSILTVLFPLVSFKFFSV